MQAKRAKLAGNGEFEGDDDDDDDEDDDDEGEDDEGGEDDEESWNHQLIILNTSWYVWTRNTASV